jgi:PAN domain
MSSSTRGADCATSCQSISTCVGFVLTYTSSGATCTLKSAMVTVTNGVASSIAYTNTVAKFSGYVFWYHTDFNGGLSGNTDGSHITTNINDAVTACNSQGTGCAGISYATTNNIYLKTTIFRPNSDQNIIGMYVKTVSGYVILPGIDVHPSGDTFFVQKNDLDCTNYCNSLGSACIAVSYDGGTNCIGRSSYVPGANSGVISFLQVRSVPNYFFILTWNL